jgi:shikimate kinase
MADQATSSVAWMSGPSQPRHVVLVGLMGSGKSTVGRRLAARLDRRFVDADAALVEVADRSIADIFATDGEGAFRALEADVLEELLEHHEPTVVASGGGVVLGAENRRRLGAPSVTVVWLRAEPAFLASRVEGRAHRPLLQGEEPARAVLARLDEERAPLYAEVADITVDVEPFHVFDDAPRLALAERVAELVVAHEAAVAAGAPS